MLKAGNGLCVIQVEEDTTLPLLDFIHPQISARYYSHSKPSSTSTATSVPNPALVVPSVKVSAPSKQPLPSEVAVATVCVSRPQAAIAVAFPTNSVPAFIRARPVVQASSESSENAQSGNGGAAAKLQPATVTLLSHHGKYVVAEPDGRAQANRDKVGSFVMCCKSLRVHCLMVTPYAVVA